MDMNFSLYHTDTYRRDLLWPLAVLIAWSKAHVIYAEQSPF